MDWGRLLLSKTLERSINRKSLVRAQRGEPILQVMGAR